MPDEIEEGNRILEGYARHYHHDPELEDPEEIDGYRRPDHYDHRPIEADFERTRGERYGNNLGGPDQGRYSGAGYRGSGSTENPIYSRNEDQYYREHDVDTGHGRSYEPDYVLPVSAPGSPRASNVDLYHPEGHDVGYRGSDHVESHVYSTGNLNQGRNLDEGDADSQASEGSDGEYRYSDDPGENDEYSNDSYGSDGGDDGDDYYSD